MGFAGGQVNGILPRGDEIMDESTTPLREKFERLIGETAAAAVALSRADGTIQGVPHYSVIEGHAHQLGRQLSREIQALRLGKWPKSPWNDRRKPSAQLAAWSAHWSRASIR
jgi:hypothetical protein